jgi:hypothetical protein
MIKIPKSEIVEAMDFNPSMLIGKKIISQTISGDELQILDVNLKCTHIFVKIPSNETHRWINVNDLDDFVVFDSFDNHDGSRITIKTLLARVPNNQSDKI